MNPQILVILFSEWQIVVISIFVMLLLPVVFYIASLDKRPVKIKRQSAAKGQNSEKGRAVNKVSAESKTEEENKQEQDEKNNSEGGKGA